MSLTSIRLRKSPLHLLFDSICRRAFSSPEAWLYELTIARALADALVPTFERSVIGPKILDVGAGGGTLDARLIERCQVEIVALDPSHAQVRRANRLAKRFPMLNVRMGFAEEIPFGDGAFDCVISSCALKHWPDPVAGLEECLRVLRVGGRLVIVEIDGTATLVEFWNFAKTSSVPFGLKRAYLRFAMRTVVGVAPSDQDLAMYFGTHQAVIERIEGMPFLLATLVK